MYIRYDSDLSQDQYNYIQDTVTNVSKLVYNTRR